MFKKSSKNNNANGKNVIIDNEVVSVDTLRNKAKHANFLFWIAVCLVTLVSGLVLPYLSMASVASANSSAFNGTLVPGYSTGGITIGAYAVDINSWGTNTDPVFPGSTYGVWSGGRLKTARSAFQKSADTSSGETANNSSASSKAATWKAITGRNTFSSTNPNGSTTETQASQYDAVMPYRTPEEITYFESSMPSSDADQNITVSLYPDFVIFSYDPQTGHAQILTNPDDLAASTNGSVITYSDETTRSGTAYATSSVPVYVPLSTLFDAFHIDSVQNDGQLASIDLLMKAISDEALINSGYSQTLDTCVANTNNNLLYNTEYTDMNSGNGNTSTAFNPYPYSMIFQKNDNESGGTPQVVTSSIYNNSEAYVYFSPQSMYTAYIALKEEANNIVGQATEQIQNEDPVTAFQLGYYYAAMAICEAYLTEALPQDMTRGYVGASEDTAPSVKGDVAGSADASAVKEALGTDQFTDPSAFQNVTYATLMYDVANVVSKSGSATGDEYALGETNAIMNSLSVFGYDNADSPSPGVMAGMDAKTTYYRLTNFTPYSANANTSYPDEAQFTNDGPNDAVEDRYTSGMYTAPYYPVQQHLMPDEEKSYRFSILSVVPYQVVLELIAENGFEGSTYLSYSSDFTGEFKSVTQYMTKASALMTQYNEGSDIDENMALNKYEFNDASVTEANGRKMLTLTSTSQADGIVDAQSRELQARVDSALMAYASSTMISDNVHDLHDVVRAVPGLKYETFMRFYNPLKSDGGDTDFFLTRVSPAMTDYFPQMLNRGYENAGGDAVSESYKTSGVSFDYFSVPSFAACFASHTGSTTYYGSLNYELRAFFRRTFLLTLSNNANVPAIEDFNEAQDALEEAKKQEEEQNEVTKQNILALFILAKRIIYSETVERMGAMFNEEDSAIDLQDLKAEFETVGLTKAKEWVTRTGDDVAWGIPEDQADRDSVEDTDIPDDKEVTFGSDDGDFTRETLAKILMGDTSVPKTALPWAKAVAENTAAKDEVSSRIRISSFAYPDSGVFDSTTNMLTSKDSEAGTDTWGEPNGLDGFSLTSSITGVTHKSGPLEEQRLFFRPKDSDKKNKHSYIDIDVHLMAIQNMVYDQLFSARLEEGGDYYWDKPENIIEYDETPVGLEGGSFVDAESSTIHTVAFPMGFSLDINKDMAKMAEEFEEDLSDLSNEIFKDVIGLAQDMQLITDSMPTQMQNVLAWADYQNSSDSENQYQTDPSEANVTVNTNVQTSVDAGDGNGNAKIYGVNDLEKYGWTWQPSIGENGGLKKLSDEVSQTGQAINEAESRMARGVAGATWTSTIQPACYTMTAIAGRQERMSVNSDQNYPYAGIVDGRLQSGMDQYALLQAHVIDYSSIASGIAGDLATRERGQLVQVTVPEVGLFADIRDMLNNIAGIFKELGLSMIRFTGGLFDDMMFSDSSATKTVVKDTEHVDATAASLFNLSSISNARNYTTQTASCTTNYVNMNRTPATTSTFDTSSGELVPAGAMSSASAATTAIEEMGSSGLLKTGYPLYSFIQSLSLALVMVFLLVIAFQNFFAYSTGRSTDFVRAQTNLKVVLPRAIIAIIMIGLPPLSDSSVGFQGGCYLLLQFISGIISQISQVFATLSGGGVIDSWIQVFESIEMSDIASILVWLICSLVISAMFLIGCVVLLLQSIILILFWAIGPIVWSLYVWPYANNPNEQNNQHRMPTGGAMKAITQKLGIGAFTRGAVGNAAPSGWVYMYTNTAAMTIMWSVLFWLVSVAISTTSLDGAGASATSTASTFGYAPTAGAVSLLTLSALGLPPFVQILLLTLICVLLFLLMIKMTMSIFKNNAFNMTGLLPSLARAIPNMGNMSETAGDDGGLFGLGKSGKNGNNGKDGASGGNTANGASVAHNAAKTAKSLADKSGGSNGNGNKDGGNKKNNGLAKRVGRTLDLAKTAKDAIKESAAGQYAGNLLKNNIADTERLAPADIADIAQRRALQRHVKADEKEIKENNDLIKSINDLNGARNKSPEELKKYIDGLATKNPEMYEKLTSMGLIENDSNGNYKLADEKGMQERIDELKARNNALDVDIARTKEKDAHIKKVMDKRNATRQVSGTANSMITAGTVGAAIESRKAELDKRERMLNPEPKEEFKISNAASARVDSAMDNAIGKLDKSVTSGAATLDSTFKMADDLATVTSGSINAAVNSTQGYEAAIRDKYIQKAAQEGCRILSADEHADLVKQLQSGAALSEQDYKSLMLTESMIDAIGGTHAKQDDAVDYMDELSGVKVDTKTVSEDVAKNVQGAQERSSQMHAIHDTISDGVDSAFMEEGVIQVPAVSNSATGTALMSVLASSRKAGSAKVLFESIDALRYSSDQFSLGEISAFEQELKRQYDEKMKDKNFIMENVSGISSSDIDAYQRTDMQSENEKAADMQRLYATAMMMSAFKGGNLLTTNGIKAIESAYDRCAGDPNRLRTLLVDDVDRKRNVVSNMLGDVRADPEASAMYDDLLKDAKAARKSIMARISAAKGQQKETLKTALSMAMNVISQSKELAEAISVSDFIDGIESDSQLMSAIATAPVDVSGLDKIVIRERNDEIIANRDDMIRRGQAGREQEEHAVAQLDASGADTKRNQVSNRGQQRPQQGFNSGEVPSNHRVNGSRGGSHGNSSDVRRRKRLPR